jgi:hypothetical protein
MFFKFCVSSVRIGLHKCTLKIVTQWIFKTENPEDDAQFCGNARRAIASTYLTAHLGPF